MKSLFTPLALLAGLTGFLCQAQLMINTPTNVVVCQPILLTWGGGTPPYIVSILPGSQPGAAALQTFPTTSSDSVTWIANIEAGTSIGLTIRDQTGATASSAPFTINAGSDTSCVGQTSSVTGSSTGSTGTSSTPTTAGATTSSGSATTTRSTTAATSTTPGTTTRSSSASGSTTSSAASTSTSNAASAQVAHIGAAGFLGAAVIALMA